MSGLTGITGMNASIGQLLAGISHIHQSLADILTTPTGSRVMRRDYGSDVPELIDQPLNGATQLRIYAATAYAVQRWEPRIQLSSVQLDYNAQGCGKLILAGVAGQQSVTLAVPVKKTVDTQNGMSMASNAGDANAAAVATGDIP